MPAPLPCSTQDAPDWGPVHSLVERHASSSDWQENAPGPAQLLGEAALLAQRLPVGQSLSDMQVAGTHEPTGSPHRQIAPGPQSESCVQP